MRTAIAAVLSALLLAPAPAAAEPAAWTLIEGIGYATGATGETRRTYPAGLVDRQVGFRITGHVVPIAARPRLDRFLLVPEASACPFCGFSGYGPSLEVEMRRPLPDLREGTEVTLTGQLDLVPDPQDGPALRLRDAVWQQ